MDPTPLGKNVDPAAHAAPQDLSDRGFEIGVEGRRPVVLQQPSLTDQAGLGVDH